MKYHYLIEIPADKLDAANDVTEEMGYGRCWQREVIATADKDKDPTKAYVCGWLLTDGLFQALRRRLQKAGVIVTFNAGQVTDHNQTKDFTEQRNMRFRPSPELPKIGILTRAANWLKGKK